MIYTPIYKMAAIIAQISLQAAKRWRGFLTKKIPIEKSKYKLPPFDTHFDAEKHNAYTIRFDTILSTEDNFAKALPVDSWWLQNV